MIVLIFYTIATLLTLFFLGYGLTLILIPEKLKPHAFWFSPWFAIIFLILSLTIFSLFGLPVKQSSPLVISILTILNLLVFFKLKLRYQINFRADLLIAAFVFISIIFNLSPLIKNEKFLTAVSFGNNDVPTYAISADHLVENTIVDTIFASQKEGFLEKPGNVGIDSVLLGGYRWGTAIFSAFFLNLFQLKGYQLVYLLQVILFGIAIPLIYIFFKILYKSTVYGLVFILVLLGFNVNLLYMLYHNFFGQIFFAGIGIVLLILFASYFFSAEEKKRTITKYDLLIAATLAALYFTYHEVIFFVISPLVLLLILRVIFGKDPVPYFRVLLKIFVITFLLSSFSVVNATIVDFLQAGNIDAPIGWQQFRNRLPYANPFEIMGFYSIHSFEPMPVVIAIFLSLLVSVAIIYGFRKAGQKLFLASFLIVYLAFFIWSGVIHHNFWAYNRAVTYTLPIFVVLFSIGATTMFKKKQSLGRIFLVIMLGLVLFSALKLNKRMLREYLSADRSFISLTELASNKNINESIYTQDILLGETLIWPRIWTEYFMYPEKSVISLSNFHHFDNLLPDGGLILFSKSSTRYVPHPLKVLLTEVIWENDYYKLGRICRSDECLRKQKEEFSDIKFGKSEIEDSLLIAGWSIKEQDRRWVQGIEASLRLKNNSQKYSSIVFEALTLKQPQRVQVYLDDIYLGETGMATEWKNYRISSGKKIPAGVHTITFKFSNTYQPKDIFPNNSDTRNLSVNFARVKME